MANGHTLSLYLFACLFFDLSSSVVKVSGSVSLLNPADLLDGNYGNQKTGANNRDRRQTSGNHNTSTCKPLIQDNETYYSMEIIKDAIDDYWIEIIGKGKQLNNDTGIYPRVDIPFSFPFYGQPVNHVFPSTLGIMSMSEHPEDSQPPHFIAPLFAQFVNDTHAAFYKSLEDKFAIEWRDVHLHSGQSLFQTLIYRNGTIVFLYKKLEENITSSRKTYMIGISSTLSLELAGTGGVSAFVKYQPLSVKPTDIEDGTAVIFSPRSPCELAEDTLCKTPHISFYCKHCRVTKHCPWSTDKLLQEWLHQYCRDNKPTGCEPDDNKKHKDSSSSTTVVVVVVVVLVAVLVIVLGGWFYYGYKRPDTKSGRWIIEHRPSQWKTMWQGPKKISKEEKSPTQDHEDSATKDGDI